MEQRRVDWNNDGDHAAFVERYGHLFESSPWVAEKAWHNRPFRSRQELLSSMSEIVMGADSRLQLELLRAHPELGAKLRMTAASTEEQRRTGVAADRLERDEAYIFQRMNAAYREKFGFPFIMAVKGLTADMTADSMQRRMMNTAEQERRHALMEVCKIAEFRLAHVEEDLAIG
ncbi:2-oxo-4-hydroxy-4-carboxy-5-ureidoimidazoline decarboxylase [Paenibacillus sp. 1011MAR3C5]|uniref:2-oxo-4-hydroxy-4-carboxy-5-ureidoimidazoline decarboxylase n=1 Tax=Paenibacillus sp. 1011MAR3C5 TaxID=1675787 RepID=UPI000E6CEB20|nr:2-oxo-4-hydroxy-4-carboxy-5-ureidoimidazoline decarboxylase [Paenibacillus sp. 1011MAR3C5]RJE86858.1 2-oxo-4-hydroxy-4-carboxy-5-ureidoimidazoline decarboxylase [Paenibacillus sp. 1011MAR3C5]